MGNGFVTVGNSCHPHRPGEPPFLPNRFFIREIRGSYRCFQDE